MTLAPIFRFAPMTEAHGEAICGWSYPEPYHLYNWPPWGEMKLQQREFADPALRREQYAAVLDEENDLIGFVQFFPMEGWTRLGLGLRPDCCGLGWGTAFVTATTAEAQRRAPDKQIDLEVLLWNERARKCYERAGFRISDCYSRNTPNGPARFYCMEYGGSS
ncbi:GNAT family N-acetyltransferase [Paenibacillus sp. y28]|uniref:GNAT family N-acetyltransferase n=1 Tax=Paenibacillus sp. y28 TaxID=3129110 RepID=UPI003015D563